MSTRTGVALALGAAALLLAVGCSSSGGHVAAGGPATTEPAMAPDCPAPPATTVGSAVAGEGGGDPGGSLAPSPDFALMAVVETYGQAHPDTYGGTWLDPSQAGDPIVVGFTADVDTRRTELMAARAGPNDVVMITPTLPPLATTVGDAVWPVQVVQVSHTVEEEQATQQGVSAFAQAEGRDLGINGVGSGPSGGRVEVDLTTVTDQARRLLAERFGDAVCVAQVGPFTPVGGSATVGSAVP